MSLPLLHNRFGESPGSLQIIIVKNDGDGGEDDDDNDECYNFSPGIGEGVLGSTPPGDSFGGVGG